MSLSNAAETALLQLIYNNTDWANIGDAGGLGGSTTPGSFFVALHSADPTEAGDQTSNEITYTGYARVAVARSSGGFTVSGNSVSNTAAVTFGEKTAGGDVTATHFSIGRDTSGTGMIINHGALTASLLISNGVIPEFPIGNLTVTVD